MKKLTLALAAVAVLAVLFGSGSNAQAAVLFSDTFGGSVIDGSRWVIQRTAGANVTQNDKLVLHGNDAWGTNGISTSATFDRSNGDLTLTARVTPGGCGNLETSGSFGYGDFDVFGPQSEGYIFSTYAIPSAFYYIHQGTILNIPVQGYVCQPGVPFTAALIIKKSGGADLFINGASSPSASIAGGTFTNKPFYFQQYASKTFTSFEDVVIRDRSVSSQVLAYDQVLATGQSLSVGYGGTPALTTSQPFGNIMLNDAATAFVPLREPATGSQGNVESISSAFANAVSAASPNRSLLVTLHGVSGVPYSVLKKGTQAYSNGVAQITAAKKIASQTGSRVVVRGVTVLHGESDELSGATPEQYKGYLLEWQNDYQNDARSITGQNDPVPLFTDQASSWTAYSHSVPHTALGQYEANKSYPDKIVLVAPLYIFDYSDAVHLTNYSYRRLGEYFAKAYKKVVIDGAAWRPLAPASITLDGKMITVRFNVPVPPLQFDTAAVDLKANYGFEYADDLNSASIADVRISAPDTVQITLSGTPTGLHPRLRYAYTGVSGSGAGAHVAGSARGNLRDSDPAEAFYQDAHVPAAMGSRLYNWAVTFDEPVAVQTISKSQPRTSSGGGSGSHGSGSLASASSSLAQSQPFGPVMQAQDKAALIQQLIALIARLQAELAILLDKLRLNSAGR